MCLAILLEFGTLVTMAEDTEPRNDVDPRPVQPLELPAYAWLLVKEYSYRHEQWCKKKHHGVCGQNCPCCRFAAGDFLGACEVGLGVRTLASVSAAVRIVSPSHIQSTTQGSLLLPASPAAARSNWRVAAAARGGASERCVRRSHTRNDAPEELPPLSASCEA